MSTSTAGKSHKTAAGFTIVELLVAIAIVGILFAIAVPSYNQSQRKSRRTDAVVAALAIQVAQENFRGSCPFYAQSLGNANTCGTTAALSTVNAASSSANGFYTMSITASSATGNAYQIKAVATGDQANDTGCDELTITFNATNPKGLKAPADCWVN